MSGRALRVVGDAGTRTAQVMGEGLVVYFGFRLERAPEGETAARLCTCLELSRPAGQSGGLFALEGAVLWVGVRDAGGNEEDLGRGLLGEVRTRVQKALALAATDGPLPSPVPPPTAPVAQPPAAPVVQETYGNRRMRERAAAEPARPAAAAPVAPDPRPAAAPAAPAGAGKKNVDPPPEPPPKKPKGRLIDPDV